MAEWISYLQYKPITFFDKEIVLSDPSIEQVVLSNRFENELKEKSREQVQYCMTYQQVVSAVEPDGQDINRVLELSLSELLRHRSNLVVNQQTISENEQEVQLLTQSFEKVLHSH